MVNSNVIQALIPQPSAIPFDIQEKQVLKSDILHALFIRPEFKVQGGRVSL